MHRSELDLTAHVPLDGADERDAERYTTTRLVRFVRKNQIYAGLSTSPLQRGAACVRRLGGAPTYGWDVDVACYLFFYL